MDAKNLAVLMQLKKAMEQEEPVGRLKKTDAPGQGFSEESEQRLAERAQQISSDPSGKIPSPQSETLREQVIDSITYQLRQEFSRLNRSTNSLDSLKYDESHSKGQYESRAAKGKEQNKLPVTKPASKNSPLSPPKPADLRMSGIRSGKCFFRDVYVSRVQYKALKESMDLMIYGNDNGALIKKFDALTFYLSQVRDDHEAMAVYEKIFSILASVKNDRAGKVGKPALSPDRVRRFTRIQEEVARLAKPSKELQGSNDTPEWTARSCLWCNSKFFVHKDWVKPPTRCKKCREKLHNRQCAKGVKKAKNTKTVYSHYVIYSGGSPGLGKRH
ncbi:TPA: hypothetical protein L4F48_002042 [Pseudomonas aeruginosa]|nr:hypothetical protein [Pseudomonas aeruginosa]HBO1578672.1 hypothetical protein [Pseudomonas aeruginosa]HCF0944728.1 hypothetical protein [Pseudomonas aeruginosa]